jgi:hypothetical protein
MCWRALASFAGPGHGPTRLAFDEVRCFLELKHRPWSVCFICCLQTSRSSHLSRWTQCFDPSPEWRSTATFRLSLSVDGSNR